MNALIVILLILSLNGHMKRDFPHENEPLETGDIAVASENSNVIPEVKEMNIDDLYMKPEREKEGVITKWYHKASNVAYTGMVVGFHKNGYEMTRANLKNGRYCGLFTEWYSNGNKACELHYRNGLLNGLAKWWYRSGYKKKQVSYENNKEVDGSKRYWYYKMDETSGGAHYHFRIENDA